MAKKKSKKQTEDRKKNAAMALLLMLCIGLVVFEITVLHRHSHFADTGLYSIDGMPGFFAILGFLGAALFIVLAKVLSPLLSREEGYYND